MEYAGDRHGFVWNWGILWSTHNLWTIQEVFIILNREHHDISWPTLGFLSLPPFFFCKNPLETALSSLCLGCSNNKPREAALIIKFDDDIMGIQGDISYGERDIYILYIHIIIYIYMYILCFIINNTTVYTFYIHDIYYQHRANTPWFLTAAPSRPGPGTLCCLGFWAWLSSSHGISRMPKDEI